MSKYIGRFAPTPNGDLHFGSLTTAMASYCEAVIHQGKWLICIDDIDTPRVVKGAARSILNTLEKLGFEWHAIHYQSRRIDHYQQFYHQLKKNAEIYPCYCSRREVTARQGSTVYDAYCYYQHKQKKKTQSAWRIHIQNHKNSIAFIDQIQGRQEIDLIPNSGDFIIKRADGILSYVFCFVVDCALDQITHIVRGADLLQSSASQIYLQQQLALPIPEYAHIPIVCNTEQVKLSKSTHSPKVEESVSSLYQAACVLGQKLDKKICSATIATFWQELLAIWDSRLIPGTKNVIIKHNISNN